MYSVRTLVTSFLPKLANALLSYVDDEAHRRRVLVQLNRHEARHGLARKVFHGQKGEVRKRYREGQEAQLGALGRGSRR